MNRGVMRWPLRSAIRSSVRLGGRTPRYFSSTLKKFQKQSPHDEKLKQQIKKLKQLQEQYESANLFDKIKLRAEILQRELEFTKATALANAKEMEVNPVIEFSKDPLVTENVRHYHTVYNFMLNAFIDQCKIHEKYPNASVNPDTIIEEIQQLYLKLHNESITKEDVLLYFHMYYELLNNIVFLDQLKFNNPTVADLLTNYVAMKPTDDKEKLIDSLALATQKNRDVIAGWFDIFDTLSSTPFADQDNKYTCPICPAEYASYISRPEVLMEKFSQYFGNGSGNGMNKNFNFQSNMQNNPKKPGSQGNKNKNKKGDPNKIEFEFNLGNPLKLFQFGVMVGLLIYIATGFVDGSNQEITFQEFTSDFLRKNLVSKIIVVNNKTAYIQLNTQGQNMHPNANYYFNIGDIITFERNLRDIQNELSIADAMKVPVLYSNEGSTGKLLFNFFPTLLFLGAIWYMTKKANVGGMGGPLGFGKSTAKKFNQDTDVKIRFKDVAGMAEAKEEVMEFVKFLQNPEKYEKLGAKIPRGAILSGPPGTGKTLIAKATAGEAGVPFYSVSGSEFVEMFVGVGASRVRDLFKTARENAPSIVFVDEIDAIGKQRSKGNASGANDERETTLNQLLVEMDGFENSDHVVVLAGTNRSDILDKALLRPGRFDRHIYIDNPELQGRKEIFEVHLKKITLASDIDPDLSGRLAALTPGFSGADIANVCNEAALIGARYNASAVSLRHFELAIERVIGGIEKKTKVLSPEEQKIVAYHEAGHAVCGWYLKYANPLLKVSIVPRGQGALGYAQYLPPDQFLYSTLQLTDRMIMTLGGRVSEELNFSSVTSGAHDDFKKVTQVAQSMVLRFGMSEKVGMVNYADTQSEDNLTKPFSDETNSIIDSEVQRLVDECYEKCRALLTEKSKEVKLVAEELLKKEFITREDMIRLLGKRPWAETNDAFDKYLDGKDAFKNEKPANEHKDDE